MRLQLNPGLISEAIQKVETLKSQLAEANEDIVFELVRMGHDYAVVMNNAAPQTGLQKSSVVGKVTESGKKGYIALQGPNAIYDEFGTGEEGATDPHPRKNEFPLNPYNSGPFVSTHVNPKNGRHYWYYPPMAGKPFYKEPYGYAEGVPSGKQMYYTAQYIRDNTKKVVQEKLSDAIKFINK